MGMFDTVKVKVALPVPAEFTRTDFNWNEQDYQTKDLDNCLGLYEISPEGRLLYLDQNRVWAPDDDSLIGGYYKVESENWKDTNFHGNIVFYTSYCDKPGYRWDFGKGGEQMSWTEILEVEGYDWWVEFLAVFDSGQLREIKLHKTEKTPIRVRLGNNKEWDDKRKQEGSRLTRRLGAKLKKIPGWKTAMRTGYRVEQKVHEKVSRFLMNLS